MNIVRVIGVSILISGLSGLLLSQQQETTAVGPPAGESQPAPAAFDGLTNGFLPPQLFDEAREIFEDVETVADGIGPTFNMSSCADCHHTPIIGGSSQVTELRAATYANGEYEDHPGGSLINDRALDASILERVQEEFEVRAFRASISILGDGFVEAIADSTFQQIAASQPMFMRGQIIRVPVDEANGTLRIGRFGWKNQHASLESFSADAYLNEMGITTPLQPIENTSLGNSVREFDTVADPEDDGADVVFFANFIRSTKAPPRDLAALNNPDVGDGEEIFSTIGCATCHVTQIVTAPVGTIINGGAFTVPPALGDKLIRPFGDYLLHDIGTGDGIIQNGGASTRNKIRTAPLWGLRTRARLMHDGGSASIVAAILRHHGQAAGVTARFQRLTPSNLRQLMAFLNSL